MIPVAAAVIRKDNKILIAKRKAGTHMEGLWEFPGGKIEEGETPEECLARELREEFGIETRIGSMINENIHDYGIKVVKLMGYEAEHLSGEFSLNAHSEIAWIGIDGFEGYELVPADLPLAERLMNDPEGRIE